MKYRKKPVIIEAREVGTEPFAITGKWCGGKPITDGGNRVVGIAIKTLEGTMRADIGDWIIQGVKGEFYPCKPDIFAATYEPVQETS